MKKRQSKLVIFLFIVGLTGYLGNLLIDNPYTQSFVNYYLNEKVVKHLPIRLEYQSIKIRLLPPAIQIFGVKVSSSSPNPADQKEIVTLSALTFRVSLWSIFLARPQVGDLELKDLTLAWPLPSDLLSKLKELEPQPKSGGPLQWPPSQPPPFSSLRITNANIRAALEGVSLNTHQDPKEITRISTEGLSLDMELHDWKSFTFEINAPKTYISDSSTSYVEDGTFKLRGEMRNKEFMARKIEFESPRLDATGSGSISIVTKPQSNVIESIGAAIQISEAQMDSSLIGSFLDIPGNRGKLVGDAVVQLKIPVNATKNDVKFSTTGHIKSYDARFYDFRLYETESDFYVDLDKFELSRLNLKIGDQVVATGGGSILFDKAIAYRFNLAPKELPFKDLLGIFNVDFDIVNFNLTSPLLSIDGTGDPFLMTVESNAHLSALSTPSVVYDHSRHREQPQCDIDFKINVDVKGLQIKGDNGLCKINGLDTSPGRFNLNLTGNTYFDNQQGIDLTLSSSEFNPAPLTYFAQASLHGNGQLKTQIKGPYDDVRVYVQTTISDFIMGSTEVGTFKGNLEIRGDSLVWNHLNIDTPTGGNIHSDKGTIFFDDPMTINFQAHASNIDHGILGRAIDDMTDGSSSVEFVLNSAELKMSGPVLQPLRWKGSATIDLSSIKDKTSFFANQVKGVIRSDDKGFSSENLLIGIAGTHVDLNVRHNWSQDPVSSSYMSGLGLTSKDSIELKGNIKPRPGGERELQLLPAIGNMAASYGISAQLDGDFKLSGNLEKLTGILRIHSTNTKVLDAAVSDISASVILDGSKIDIMADQGGSALKARVNLDLGKESIPFRWYISAQNADFRPWLPSMMSSDARNFAYISAIWNLEGELSNWWKSHGQLEIKDVRARYYAKNSRSQQKIDLRLASRSTIEFNGKEWIFKDSDAVIFTSSLGEIKFGLNQHAPPQKLGITVNGRVDTDAVKAMLPDIETATGSLMFTGNVTGAVDDPKVKIALKNSQDQNGVSTVSIGHASFRPSLQNIKLDAELELNRIIIKEFKATKGTGAILANGAIAVPGSGKETDVSINFENASFLYPFPIVKYFDSSLGGQIKVSGSSLPYSMTGRVVIDKARSNRDIDIREAILESIRSQGAPDATDSIRPILNFDISLVASNSISFSSRTGQANLSADLKIGGNNVVPNIMGLVDVQKGRFFYKRDFQIVRGLINFDDPVRVDPALDIHAASEVSNYRVGINISGRASSPLIDFTVDPPSRPDGMIISKIEIIALLNRGSLPEAGAGRGSSESAAAAEALNLLAGQVEDTVQRIFDLSGQNIIRQVYIDTYADSEGSPVARFNLPLNITDDLDVILKVDQNTVKVSSEYSLHDSISLTGGIENNNEQTKNSKATGIPADTGVDLKFKFAFP